MCKIPYSFDEKKQTIKWCELDDQRFIESFFYDTVRNCLRIERGSA